MHQPQEARPRARSPFAAAFLSLIFPGLGQIYAGAVMRGLAFAAAPILLIALGSGVFLRMDRTELIGVVLNPLVLQSVFVVNLVVLIYRIVAIVDAYRVADFLNAHDAGGTGRLGPARLVRNPLSLAGLLAVILVMAGVHVVVARYDMLALDVLDSGCIFIGDDQDAVCADDSTGDAEASSTPDASETPDQTDTVAPTESPTPEPTITGTPVPEVSIPPWDGKKRLNILLIGADVQGGGHNTDTLITVSIDPVTKQVAMFSLPRDMSNVPLPPGPPRSFWGSTFGSKINSLWAQNRNRSDLWPGNKSTRGYNALKSTLSELYGIDIRYFVEVNFEGFKKVLNELGGVTVNVQIPVVDDSYPGRGRRRPAPLRAERPPAHERHGGAPLRPFATHAERLRPRGPPAAPAALPARAGRTRRSSSPACRSWSRPSRSRSRRTSRSISSPSCSGSRRRSTPRTSARTSSSRRCTGARRRRAPRSTRCSRTSSGSARRSRARSTATRSTSSRPRTSPTRAPPSGCSRGSAIAPGPVARELPRVPRSRGVFTPAGSRPGAVPAATKIVVYNGADSRLTDTIAFLEKTFKVKAQLATDPAISTDVVITIGRNTPDLEAPPLS